jgi:hypothetical protein
MHTHACVADSKMLSRWMRVSIRDWAIMSLVQHTILFCSLKGISPPRLSPSNPLPLKGAASKQAVNTKISEPHPQNNLQSRKDLKNIHFFGQYATNTCAT